MVALLVITLFDLYILAAEPREVKDGLENLRMNTWLRIFSFLCDIYQDETGRSKTNSRKVVGVIESFQIAVIEG